MRLDVGEGPSHGEAEEVEPRALARADDNWSCVMTGALPLFCLTTDTVPCCCDVRGLYDVSCTEEAVPAEEEEGAWPCCICCWL